MAVKFVLHFFNLGIIFKSNMVRIRIDLPSKYVFSTEIKVRISDINYGGHLGHETVLSLSHEARVRLLTKHNFSELDIDGAGLIMADVGVVYKSECFYGDTVKVSIGAGDHGKRSFEFIYLLENSETSKEIARAKTGLVFFDYKNRKSVSMPKIFKDAFF